LKTIRHFITFLLAGTATISGGTPQKFTSPDQAPGGLAQSDWQSIRAAYEAGRHAFQCIEGGWHARNPGQQWTTKFDGRGFVAEPRSGGWQWGLELKSYGFPGAERTVGGAVVVKAGGQRLTYDWDATVQEWFVNDARGLEHGFTLKERPAKALNSQPSTLNFLLSIRGTLRPQVSADAHGVAFQDASGATVLNYSGLKVWDADGRPLPSRFELAVPQLSTAGGNIETDESAFPLCSILNSQPCLRLLVEERGARYPLTIDPIAQQACLKASNTGEYDFFGSSVAVSGDTVVVGAYGEDSNASGVNGNQANNSASTSGAAYVFARSGTTWTQQAYLKASNTGAGDQFGVSVAVSGDTVVVGADLEDSNATGVNGNQADNSASWAGAAYVFVRSGTTWTQQAYLKASNTWGDDWFGTSVGVSGDTVVVGAYGEDSNATGVNGNKADDSAGRAGAAYVFTRSGTSWTQQAYLKASNTEADDRFGLSVAVSDDTVVIGTPGEDSNATGVNGNQADNLAGTSGAAYVFTRSGTSWTQQAYLKASNAEESDLFGTSVAVSGDTVVVGAYGEDSIATGVNANQTTDDSARASGAAYVFTRSGTTWTQQAYLKASNTGESDSFGWSVAVSDDTVVVGAYGEDSNATGINGNQADNSAGASGAAYVFTRSGTNWTQRAYLKASNTGGSDSFGWSVTASGETVVVGAYGEDSNATGVNGNKSNDSAGDAGATYIFTGFGPPPDADNDGLFDSWELTYWPTTTGHSALDDFDGDGYVELLELALGLNPKIPNPGGLPPVTSEGGYLTITLTKQPGVTYEVQTAGTLLEGQPVSFSPASTTVLNNDAATLKVRDNIFIGTAPGRFIRVKVTAAP
jgi:FG-GAP repeat